MPDLIQNQQQLNHVLNNLDGVDLFVLTLGGAHSSDTQQQCPNFCIEAAEQGQKVVIVNIDPSFIHTNNQLINNTTHQNIICHYGTLSYISSESENIFNISANKILCPDYLKIMHEGLIKNEQLKIVYLYQITNMIPEFYLANANPEEANRVRFLGSYYKNSPGHIYSPVELNNALKSKSLDRNFNKFKHSLWYDEDKEGGRGRTLAEYLDDKEKQEEWLRSFEKADLGLNGYSFICLHTVSLETLFSPDVFGSENQQQRNQWRTQEASRFAIMEKEEKQQRALALKNAPAPIANPLAIAQEIQKLIMKALKPYRISGFTDNPHKFDRLIWKNWPKIRQIAIDNNLFKEPEDNSTQEHRHDENNLPQGNQDDMSNPIQKHQQELWEKIKKKFEGINSKKKEEILAILNERFVKGDIKLALNAYRDEQGETSVLVNALEFWLVIFDFVEHKDKNFPLNNTAQIIESIYQEDGLTVSHAGFVAKAFAETGMAAYYQKQFSQDSSVTENAPNDTTRADVEVVERIIKRLERNSRSCCSPGSAKKASDLRVALNNAVVMGIEDVRTDEEIKRIVSKHRSISFFRKTKSLQELENSFVEENIRP